MNPCEIVVYEVQRHGSVVVGQFIRERDCEAGEPPHAHAHGEPLALHVAFADVLWIGIAGDFLARTPMHFAGLARLSLRRSAVQLLQDRIINIVDKGFLDSFEARPATDPGDLQALDQALAQIVDESQFILVTGTVGMSPRQKVRNEANTPLI